MWKMLPEIFTEIKGRYKIDFLIANILKQDFSLINANLIKHLSNLNFKFKSIFLYVKHI